MPLVCTLPSILIPVALLCLAAGGILALKVNRALKKLPGYEAFNYGSEDDSSWIFRKYPPSVRPLHRAVILALTSFLLLFFLVVAVAVFFDTAHTCQMTSFLPKAIKGW
jgi:hypothetical protein